MFGDFFVNLFGGLGQVAAWLMGIWLLIVLIVGARWLIALMTKGSKPRGIFSAGLIMILVIPIVLIAMQVAVTSAGYGLGKIENEYLPQARQQSQTIDLFVSGVESVGQTGSLCGIAPSFCNETESVAYVPPGGGTTYVAPAGGGQPAPAGGSTVPNNQQPSVDQPVVVVPMWVPLDGEALYACVFNAYGEMRISEKIATHALPYRVRIDGTSPVRTDWAHHSQQIIIVKLTRGVANHYRLYSPMWPSFIMLDNRVGKQWADDAPEIGDDSAESLIEAMAGTAPVVNKAWVLQGTGDWPHACYYDANAVSNQPAEEPEADVIVTEPPLQPVALTCDYQGQATEGQNLYNWIGSVPTGAIRELNPGIAINRDGQNQDAILGIVWPEGHNCP